MSGSGLLMHSTVASISKEVTGTWDTEIIEGLVPLPAGLPLPFKKKGKKKIIHMPVVWAGMLMLDALNHLWINMQMQKGAIDISCMTGKSIWKWAASWNVLLSDAVVFNFPLGKWNSLTLLRLMQSFPMWVFSVRGSTCRTKERCGPQ